MGCEDPQYDMSPFGRFVFDLPCKSAAGSQSKEILGSLRSTEEQLVAAGTISVSEVQHFDGTLITVPFGTGEPADQQ